VEEVHLGVRGTVMSIFSCLDRRPPRQLTIPIIFRLLCGDSDGDGDGWCGMHERTEFLSFLGTKGAG
jgi:hypothetical protein